MKHLTHIFTTLVIIMATAFSVNAQTDKEILESLAEGLEIGLKQEMNNASMKGIMTGGNCEYKHCRQPVPECKFLIVHVYITIS